MYSVHSLDSLLIANRSFAEKKNCQIFGRNCKQNKTEIFLPIQTVDESIGNVNVCNYSKMVVISTETHNNICEFCSNFKGLTFHCEQELYKTFADIDAQVLSAILSKEWQKHIKHGYHIISRKAHNLLRE